MRKLLTLTIVVGALALPATAMANWSTCPRDGSMVQFQTTSPNPGELVSTFTLPTAGMSATLETYPAGGAHGMYGGLVDTVTVAPLQREVRNKEGHLETVETWPWPVPVTVGAWSPYAHYFPPGEYEQALWLGQFYGMGEPECYFGAFSRATVR